MYFLTNFCRICIQSGVKLLDLDTLDFDEVKLSEKLAVCTKMVVDRESFSTEICMQCVAKLRISYQFYDMCKKSTNTLQSYLNNLVGMKAGEKITPDNFVNTELSVFITPLRGYDNFNESSNYYDSFSKFTHYHREKRKRITKEQRCSLLKRLLTPSEKKKKERDKISFDQYYRIPSRDNFKGLRNIINFTNNYEFGLKLDKNSNYESTPLDKLKAFSTEYFRRDFSEFNNTILYIIENKDNLCDSEISDDEDGFNIPAEEEEDTKESLITFEEVVVEPDVKIKTEIDNEDCEDDFPYSYGEYNDCMDIKTEASNSDEKNISKECTSSNYSDFPNNFSSGNDSIHFLNSFVGSYPHRRTFYPNNMRCRTRDNPYINPILKEQFLQRSFRCLECSRSFKSPGYLKAHYSKVH